MRIRQAAIGALLCALAAGCSTAAEPPPPPTSDTSNSAPTSADATGTAVGATTRPTDAGSSGPASTPVPTPSLSTVPLPHDVGPRAMPASDGRPMLWPLSAPTAITSSGSDVPVVYGFLDATGTLVLPKRYSSYTYCPDATGRAAYLITERAGGRAEVHDLTGTLLRRVRTPSASCAGPSHVVVTDWVEPELNQHNDGLLDVTTGTMTLSTAKNRHVTAIDDHTVNVSDPTGEFFLDLATGRRTPHPGWVLENYALREVGAPAVVPAATKPSGAVIGFLDLTGTWAVRPRYADTYGFTAGHAIVQLSEDRWTLLDSSLRESGGEWQSVEAVMRDYATGSRTVGYLLSGAAGQQLVDADLRVLVPAGPARIVCWWEADGACAVSEPDGTTRLVTLPDGAATPLPAGFDQVLSRAFVADGGTDADTGIRHILALGSDTPVDLMTATSCRAAGSTWVVCEPAGPTLAPIVLDRQGRRTAYAWAGALADPVAGAASAYYQVTAGRYRGVVDEAGNWRYRESIYTRLED